MIRSQLSLLQQVKQEHGISNHIALDDFYFHEEKENIMTRKPVFRRVIENKGLVHETFIVLDCHGEKHDMTVQEVLDHVEKTSNEEKALIERHFRSIEDRNGDLLHYIRFLGQAIMNQKEK